MEKLYNNAVDEHVSATYIYGKSGDTKAYADSKCTVQMKTSELQEAVLKRAVIKIGTAIYIPVSFTITSNVGSVGYIKPNATTSTSADIGSLAAVKD